MRARLPGDPPVEIILRQSARAVRISLRVSALDGRVTLSLPPGMDPAEALDFARQKSEWIRGHLARHPAPVRPKIGGSVQYRGAALEIRAGNVRRAIVDGGTIVVPDEAAMVTARVKALLRLDARQRLRAVSEACAATIGHRFGRITLRDTRSRWGSCSARGDLMYSWRLIMAPDAVLDYVAAHEVAHLAEMNHSSAFWAVVARLCPEYQAPRLWLRQNGQQLHRYDFDD